mgnify:CR=1 FL=1
MKYLKEIIFLLDKDQKKIPLLIFIFIVVSMLDFIGIALVGSYIALIVGQDQALSSELFSAMFNIILGTESPSVLEIGFLIFFIFLLKAFIGILINYVVIQFCQRQELRLRSHLMSYYQFMPYTEHIQRNSSEYIHSITQLVGAYSGTLLILLKLMSDSAIGIAILILLGLTSFKMLLILLILLGILVYIFDLFFKKRLNSYGVLVNISQTEMIKGVHEGIEGLKEIRILSTESFFHGKVKNAAAKALRYHKFFKVISTLPRYLLEVVIVGFIVMLVTIAVYSGNNLQELIVVLGIFGVASMKLIPVANIIVTSLTTLRFNRNSVSVVYKDVQNISDVSPTDNRLISNDTSVAFKVLKLNNISFKHETASHNIISNVSIEIRAGESIGIVGPSGSGKTTLIDLILGLLEPQEGEIFLNNKSLTQVLEVWRSQVAYLPQQVFLIDDSLKSNIALGVEDKDINHIKLSEAIKRAQLADLINELPNGVETEIGEQGVRISGGQRQRVSLARAFYHDRNILVLDESTSALDDETEKEIVKEIKSLKGKVTMIIIAHRLSTIEHCDYIFRLDSGKVIKQ